MNPIYHEYKRLAEEAINICESKKPKILKTDLCNEDRDGFYIIDPYNKSYSSYFVEINYATCAYMRELDPAANIIEGDISDLFFRDKFLDIVIDCSTIDHIFEYEKALLQYARVLKENGILLIIVWLDSESREDNGQYYFEEVEFNHKLGLNFSIIKKETFPNAIGGDGTLTAFICRRH